MIFLHGKNLPAGRGDAAGRFSKLGKFEPDLVTSEQVLETLVIELEIFERIADRGIG